ncbi:MAG: hypothetical protein NC306_06920 [Butyrivibrio sp.]|nr:hypothetical protein [Butyrivibrio sp.]MCM1343643.1 hypothetical protein [Muribaculaceae bacterium]
MERDSSCASKGKVEYDFRTLRTRFLDTLDTTRIGSIGEFDPLLAAYIRTHNTSVHSATGSTPYARYMEDPSRVRMPRDSAFILDGSRRFPITPTDKAANSRTKRDNNPYSVRYGGGTP